MFPSKATILSGGAGNRFYILQDGADEGLNCGASSDFDIETNLSISVWVYFDSIGIHDQIFAKQEQSPHDFSWAFGFDASSKLHWVMYQASGSYSNRVGCTYQAASLSTGTWYHLVVTTNGTTKAGTTMYANNSLVTTASTGDVTEIDSIVVSETAVRIGNDGDSGQGVQGRLDEASIFNKVLNATEISLLYGGGTPQTAGDANDVSNLVGYWKFEEGGGSSVADSSSNSNTGTLENGAVFVEHS